MKTLIAVAVTALITSAGATAVTHALITSADIKDGAIQMRDLSPLTRLALRPSVTDRPIKPADLNRDLEKLCRAVREMQFKLREPWAEPLFVCVYFHP